MINDTIYTPRPTIFWTNQKLRKCTDLIYVLWSSRRRKFELASWFTLQLHIVTDLINALPCNCGLVILGFQGYSLFMLILLKLISLPTVSTGRTGHQPPPHLSPVGLLDQKPSIHTHSSILFILTLKREAGYISESSGTLLTSTRCKVPPAESTWTFLIPY
jgi:hypothetical protein